MSKELTTDFIINLVCQALELDRDKLIADSIKGVKKDYRDGRLILTHLLRRSIFTNDNSRPITYKEISKVMKRKCPETAMASELACGELLKYDKGFGRKYEKVVMLISKVD